MIVSKIQGGLGNQMFQWALHRYLSLRNDTDTYLDLSAYDNYNRPFSLSKFSISYDVMNSSNITNRILDNFYYKDIILDTDKDYYIDGYWQCEKYFIDIEDVIRDDFSPTDLVRESLLKTPFIDKNIVSMHIRRTDYVSSNGYHPIQPISYYEKALEVIGDYDYIFIFSDDIDWCRENLKFERMIFMTGFTDIEDMYLMSMCKNNIIANSSFSWWGAWLNNNPNKIVVAPLNWFGQSAGLNSSDIVPESWIKI